MTLLWVTHFCFQDSAKRFISFCRRIPSDERALQNRVFVTENIEVLTNATVSEINGDTKVTSVTLLQNGEEKQLDCNGVFVAVGSVPDTKPLANLVKTDKYGYIIADGGNLRGRYFCERHQGKSTSSGPITAVSSGANCDFGRKIS